MRHWLSFFKLGNVCRCVYVYVFGVGVFSVFSMAVFGVGEWVCRCINMLKWKMDKFINPVNHNYFSEIFPEFSSQAPRRPKQFEDDVEGTDEDGGDESADQVRVPFLA